MHLGDNEAEAMPLLQQLKKTNYSLVYKGILTDTIKHFIVLFYCLEDHKLSVQNHLLEVVVESYLNQTFQ